MYEHQYNPFAQNLAVVKEYFSKGRILAMGIFQAISAVLAVIATLLTVNRIDDLSQNMTAALFDSMNIPPEMLRQYTSASSAGSLSAIISVAVSAVVTLLIAAAFIIMYVKSRNDAPTSSPKAGIMIMRVFSIIAFVCAIIFTVLVGLVVILIIWMLVAGMDVFTEFSAIDLGDGMTLDFVPGVIVGVAIVVIITLIIIAVIMLLFTSSYKRFYGSVKESISSVELHTEGAKMYGVLCIIGAVFAGVGALSAPVTMVSSVMSGSSGSGLVATIVAELSSVVSFVILILNAVIALGYKKFIDDKKYGYSAPPVTSAASYIPPTAPASPAAPADPENPYADSFNNINAAPEAPQAPPVCPSCGAPVDPTAPFCSQCGNRLR